MHLTQAQQPHLIFATNFSEACYSAIPTVAHWVDTLKARLTLLHVHSRTQRRDARAALDSFFAEASAYPGMSRELRIGHVAHGIAALCRANPDSLLVMPPSEATGLPRPFHSSLRAQVLSQVNTPMLTLSAARTPPPAIGSSGHIACWMSGKADSGDHLEEAVTLARRHNATLHLLYVLPEVDEGLLSYALLDERPLSEAVAQRWLYEIADRIGGDLRVQVHVSVGAPEKVLGKLVREARADTLVMERDSVISRNLLGLRMHAALADCPCLLVCVPPRGQPQKPARQLRPLELIRSRFAA